MDSAAFPSLKRLSGALGEAARVTNQINQLMNETEAYKWELNNTDKNGLAVEQKTLNRRYNQKYNTLTPDNKARADAGNFIVP